MTPKTLLNALLLISGLLATAQVQADQGKMFIINESNRPAVLTSENPQMTLLQTERVELTAFDSKVAVQKCGPQGCQLAVGEPVSLEAINQVNRSFRAVDLNDAGTGGSCRVCMPAKSIPGDLKDYVERVKTVAPQFDR